MRRGFDETGKGGKVGCLVLVALIALLIYIGKDFAAMYFRYYQIHDEVKSQAGFAQALTDAAIRDRLVLTADSLDIVIGPKQWQIKRTRSPAEITIEGTYADSVIVSLPGYRRVFRFHFTPSAKAPL